MDRASAPNPYKSSATEQTRAHRRSRAAARPVADSTAGEGHDELLSAVLVERSTCSDAEPSERLGVAEAARTNCRPESLVVLLSIEASPALVSAPRPGLSIALRDRQLGFVGIRGQRLAEHRLARSSLRVQAASAGPRPWLWFVVPPGSDSWHHARRAGDR